MTKKSNITVDEPIKAGVLNEVIVTQSRRPNGTLRETLDFDFCPSMAEQHTGHLTDINYLMERYKPDELAAYIAARAQYKQEIIGHDFAQEPDMQGAKNIIYESRQAFENLPEDIRNNFKSHLEFLKFIDNPQNVEKMVKMGILTKKQIQDVQIPETASEAKQKAADDVGGQ